MVSYINIIENMLGGGSPYKQYQRLNLICWYAELGKFVFDKAANIDFFEDNGNTELDNQLIFNSKFKKITDLISNEYKDIDKELSIITKEN